jgi:hypothetical protein
MTSSSSDERRRLRQVARAHPEELLDALLVARMALADAADTAGDVPFWNEGGDGYAAVQRIDALLNTSLDAPA